MHRIYTTLRCLLACLALATLVACGGSPDPSSEDGPADVYSTRGVVRSLPSADSPGSQLQIRHEELPDFKNIDGEVVGMKSMTMPFPADPSLLEGVAVGDKVDFDFEVRWSGSPPMELTRLAVLPPETVLDFETSGNEPADATDDSLEEPVLEAPTEGAPESTD